MEYLIMALITCYGLSPDQHSFCQAWQHNNVGYCYSISDPSLMQACRSEIEHTPIMRVVR